MDNQKQSFDSINKLLTEQDFILATRMWRHHVSHLSSSDWQQIAHCSNTVSKSCSEP